MKEKKNLDLKALLPLLATKLRLLQRYAPMLFFVFLATIYSFLLFRINVLGNAQPSQSDITSAAPTTRIPHIDNSVVSQLQTLKDNSVNVQALFDRARSNPFHE